jgi:hypothetical protein
MKWLYRSNENEGSHLSTAGRYLTALIPFIRYLKGVLATIEKVKPAFSPAISAILIALMNRPEVRSGKISFRKMQSFVRHRVRNMGYIDERLTMSMEFVIDRPPKGE